MSKRHRTRQQIQQGARQQQPRTVGSLALADAPSNPAKVVRTFTPAPMAGNNQYNSQQWGANTSSGETPQEQYFPTMPAVKDDKPLLTNIGAPGTAIFSGVVTSEEYNPDFYWKDGIKIYEQMLRNDAQVNAVREIVEQPILRAEKHIIPGSSSARDKEIASFVETCLFEDMRYTSVDGIEEAQTWDSLLRHILMHQWYGFMCFEQVWRIEDGWVKWARWTPLLPRTVWRWWVGNDNSLTGIQQWTFREHNYQFVDIPAKKLVRFHRRLEGQNYEGVSALRSAYKHWFYKVQFEKIEAIGAERNAVIPAVIKLPEGFTQADYTNAQAIVSNIRANQSMGVTIPNTWDIEYLRNFQRQAVQLQDSIQYHDVMIARNMLAQFINLGSTETGAYSLDDSQRKDFLNNLQSICCSIEDTINLGPIKQLVDYNFDGVEVYPKLQFDKVLMSDLTSMADALSKLTTAGLIHGDPELEDALREAAGLPGAPQSVISAYNPTAPSTPSRPDNANADSHDTQQPTQAKPVVNGTTNNGPDDGGNGGGDNGGGDGGGGGGALSEVRALAEALRATVQAIDPVERGMLFYAPDQARDSHGRFEDEGAPSKGRGGSGRGRGGSAGGAKSKGEHEATAKSGKSSGASRSSGESKAAKAKAETAPRVPKAPKEPKAQKAPKAKAAPKAAGGKDKLGPIDTPEHRVQSARNGLLSAHKLLLQIDDPHYGMPEHARGPARARVQQLIHEREAELTRAEHEVKIATTRATKSSSTAKGKASGGKSEEEKTAAKTAKSEHLRNANIERMRRENEAERAAKPKGEPLVPIGHALPGERFTIDPFAAPDPHFLSRVYGPHQLDRALQRHSHEDLKQTVENVQREHPGTKPANMSRKQSLIDYIVEHTAGKEHVAAPKAKATKPAEKAPGQKATKAAKTEKAATAKSAGKTPEKLAPLVPIGHARSGERFTIDPFAPPNPQFLTRVYGHQQLGRALQPYMHDELKGLVSSIRQEHPGTKPKSMSKKQDLIDYIVQHTPASEGNS